MGLRWSFCLDANEFEFFNTKLERFYDLEIDPKMERIINFITIYTIFLTEKVLSSNRFRNTFILSYIL